MWIVEALVNHDFTQRLIEGKDDFELGVAEGIKESLGLSRKPTHIEDDSMYLLGKIIGNSLVGVFFAKMLVDTATIAGGGGLVLAGIGATTGGGGIVVVAGLAAVVATASTATCLVSNSIAFASSLGSGGSSGDETDHMLGQNGAQTSSKTVWKNGRTERVDVENPSPGNRPGQIHYHDSNNIKWYYDINENVFYNQKTGKLASNKIQKILSRQDVRDAIKKALKILGEN